jgi:hypothetical protein
MEHKMCVLISCTHLSDTLLIIKRIQRDTIIISLHEKCLLFLSDIMKFEFSRHIFEKYSNIKSHENPSSGIGIVTCGETDGYT